VGKGELVEEHPPSINPRLQTIPTSTLDSHFQKASRQSCQNQNPEKDGHPLNLLQQQYHRQNHDFERIRLIRRRLRQRKGLNRRRKVLAAKNCIHYTPTPYTSMSPRLFKTTRLQKYSWMHWCIIPLYFSN